MSGTIIKDGRGSGRSAEVDDHGRLYTKSNIVGHMSHHATYHKNGFIELFETTLPDSNETQCMYVENSNTGKEFEIYWLRISSNSDVEIIVRTDASRTSGGNSKSMTNTYIGNGNVANATAYEGGSSGNLVVDATESSVIDGIFLAANDGHEFEYDGGIVIPFSRTFSISAIGAVSDKVKIMLGVAMHETGTKL